jgi:hypothetical protein
METAPLLPAVFNGDGDDDNGDSGIRGVGSGFANRVQSRRCEDSFYRVQLKACEQKSIKCKSGKFLTVNIRLDADSATNGKASKVLRQTETFQKCFN